MRPWAILVLAGCALGVASADKLTLADDARLTGTVRSINEAGVIELSSILSSGPVLLKADAVDKVEFSTPESQPPPARHDDRAGQRRPPARDD